MQTAGEAQSVPQTNGVAARGTGDTKTVGFLKSLAWYYSEFLETGFHLSRNPSRKLTTKNREGLRVGIPLNQYPTEQERAWALVHSKFDHNGFARVSKPDEAAQPELLPQETGGAPTASFYGDLFELWKNRQTLDKQEFYLYFYDVEYAGVKYPIFYIAATVERADDGSFSFEFEPIFYINKTALQYIGKKLGEETNTNWAVEIPQRINYLANFDERSFLDRLQRVINDLTDFARCQRIDVRRSKPQRVAGAGTVTISNQCAIAIFDKSDESLVTDYEDLLQRLDATEPDEATEAFIDLITGFLFKNPQGFESLIDAEYDAKSVPARLSFASPVPLNREQQQVLIALSKPGCDRVVIEGPPGTGKTHTITAIICDALYHGKSVLMVSDTQEALDAVEAKIVKTLNQVKVDDVFQNPILRLGKKNNNYSKIFNQNNFDKIKARFKSFAASSKNLDAEISKLESSLHSGVEREIESEVDLQPAAVQSLLEFEASTAYQLFVNAVYDEFLASTKALNPSLLLELKRSLDTFCASLSELEKAGINAQEWNLSNEQQRRIKDLEKRLSALQSSRKALSHEHFSSSVSQECLSALEAALDEAGAARRPLIGYLFSGSALRKIEERLARQFPAAERVRLPHDLTALRQECDVYRAAAACDEEFAWLGCTALQLLKQDNVKDVSRALTALRTSAEAIRTVTRSCPGFAASAGLDANSAGDLAATAFAKAKQDDVDALSAYVGGLRGVERVLATREGSSFTSRQHQLQNRLIFKMSSILDQSIIKFREERRSDAGEMAKAIKAKRQIPSGLLPNLTAAFPCIIVGIRDLAEFIPLSHQLFDIVIIDEASQVSIAQAFPAILRAKKVVVLGDERQYSNVKSAHAAEQVNTSLFKSVLNAFGDTIGALDPSERDRFATKARTFNIKTSILEFVKNIANYSCSLKKHFRGYIELIDYSNEQFYQRSLQVMKIRGKAISDVIKVHLVEGAETAEKAENTNRAEAEAILAHLQELKEAEFSGKVGIITPFTNQQTLLNAMIVESRDYKFFTSPDGFDLRVWTFDTCQGQERDVIIYSMVERPGEKKLNYIFPVNMNALGDEDEGTLKAQRLNVGFSRAMETIEFFVSKSLEQFTGEIGKALRHFDKFLEEQDLVHLREQTDPRSKMENNVLQMIFQTDFFREHKDSLEIKPGFDLGRYIKQLDPYAKIPNYKVDFLLIHHISENEVRQVIIEYDGYEYHFRDREFVNELTVDQLLVEQDVERQKTIESYGYPFIRLNKFVLKRNPIAYIDEKIREALKKKDLTTNS